MSMLDAQNPSFASADEQARLESMRLQGLLERTNNDISHAEIEVPSIPANPATPTNPGTLIPGGLYMPVVTLLISPYP
jgi:hypothetical protein